MASIITGVSVAIFNRYRLQNFLGWVTSIAGFILLSFIGADTSGAKLAGLQITAAVGVGILYTAVTFPILAPLGVSENAHALAFFMFVRTFSYVSTVTSERTRTPSPCIPPNISIHMLTLNRRSE